MTVRQQYQKERKRVRDTISRMKRQGYDVSKIKLPDIPKRITAGSVRRLQKMTAQSLSDKARTYYKGKMISRTEHKKIEKERKARERKATREIEKSIERSQKRDAERREKQQKIRKESEESGRAAEKRRKIAEEQQKAREAAGEQFDDFASIVITRFKDYMLGYPAKVYKIVVSVIDRAIKEQGASRVAHAINEVGDKVEHFMSGLYGQSEDEAVSFAMEIIEHIPDIQDDEVDAIYHYIDREL